MAGQSMFLAGNSIRAVILLHDDMQSTEMPLAEVRTTQAGRDRHSGVLGWPGQVLRNPRPEHQRDLQFVKQTCGFGFIPFDGLLTERQHHRTTLQSLRRAQSTSITLASWCANARDRRDAEALSHR